MPRSRGWRWIFGAMLALSLVGCAMRAAAPEAAPTAQWAEPRPVEEMAERESKADAAQGARLPSLDTANLAAGQEVERKIIYNASLHLIVADTSEALAEIKRLADTMGGFIADSNVWRDEGHPRATVTVRVPAEKLEDALSQFRGLAVEVESESLDSQDVTEEYVDLQARLKNEQRTEAELLQLLESRSETGKTTDILEVHRELGQVRSQIEQIQGRLNYLSNLSSMATVRITLTPDALQQPVIVAGWQPKGTARNAVRTLLRTLQFFADFAIVFFLLILPVVLVIAIPLAALFLIGRAIWRRIKRRRAERKEAQGK